MFFKAVLIYINKIILLAVFLSRRGIGTSLLEPGHFLRHVQFNPPLGFDHPDFFVAGADGEIGRVIGKVAIGLDVIELEPNGKVVFRERLHIGRFLQKSGEQEFKAAAILKLRKSATIPRRGLSHLPELFG